jgi:hypothetical protein
LGDAPTRREIAAVVEHVLSDRPGLWRVTILGSRATDTWDMKVEGPKGYERSYTLIGSAGEQQPQVVGNVLAKLLPPKTV